jgi:putative sterol carrier protein
MNVFSEEWLTEWKKKINENASYRQAAQTWEWPLILIFEKDPSAGVDEDRAVYLDLWHGECRDARVATKEDIQNSPYVISADPYTWKQIFDRKLEPISTIMRGRMKLIKGNMSTLSAYVLAAKYLVESALELDLEFPEELK